VSGGLDSPRSGEPRVPAIYCVHLASSTGRRARMEQRLRHHGLLTQATFVTAAEAATAGEPPWSPGSVPDHEEVEHWKHRAAQACLATHLSAMRAMLAHPDSAEHGAIICENDVLLHNDFAARFAAVKDNLPPHATCCSLGYLIGRWDAEFTWAGCRPERENVCRMVPTALWGVPMYWISHDYAGSVLEAYGDLEVDELPVIAEVITHESDGYASYPALALEEAADSTIRPADDLDFHVWGQAAWRYSDYAAAETGDALSPLAHSTREKPTIALCMIVRDEAEVIARCLESVRPLIDSWVICDTGSSDATPQLVAELLSDIPGALHQRKWRDFGWNRTELMTLAAGAADYLLLLDADMTLHRRGPLAPLAADAYLLRHSGALDYSVPRLVRADRRWFYTGSTHEYLSTEGDFTQERLESLVVEHHADGGARSKKLERDARLLERELARDPDNDRATFYLAQTHRDLGDHERAVELYRRRVELGGWDEEVFYAAYQAGALLAARDDEAAVGLLFEAWQRRPLRAEPLYELARFARLRGWHQAAYVFAQRGVQVAYPDDVLFVHRWIYEWGLRFELAIAAYWMGDNEEALRINESLLAEHCLPPEFERAARGNLDHCLDRVGRAAPARPAPLALAKLAPSLRVAEIRIDVSPAWPQFNPTIAEADDGYRLIVRTANYRLRDGRYEFLTDEHVIRTINYLVELDADLAVTSIEPLIDGSAGPPRFPGAVQGYEDLRLVRAGAHWYATATVRDRNPDERCEIALLGLDQATIESVRLLRGPSTDRHEKNWMPFAGSDGGLRFLYGCDPTIVLEADPATGACEIVSERPGPEGADRFRGGSQGITVDGGRLFVIHEAGEVAGVRSYGHRFVLLDDAHALTAASPEFQFAAQGVEFCAGMARRGDELLLTFGVGDHTAMLGVVDVGEVLAMLQAAAVT
jgi:glycosyltransferase involved in cell wall biosynthesis